MQSMGKTFYYLNRNMDRQRETVCLRNKTSSGLLYCSCKFRLEGTGNSWGYQPRMSCSTRTWKMENWRHDIQTKPMFQMYLCHHSQPPGLEPAITWSSAKMVYKTCLSQNWTIYDSSPLCNIHATVIGLLMWTSLTHFISLRLMRIAFACVQKRPWSTAMPTSHMAAILLPCGYFQMIFWSFFLKLFIYVSYGDT